MILEDVLFWVSWWKFVSTPKTAHTAIREYNNSTSLGALLAIPDERAITPKKSEDYFEPDPNRALPLLNVA